MLDDKNLWTGNIKEGSFEEILPAICEAFNNSPFMRHNQFIMQVNAAGDNIQCSTHMSDTLIGNVHFGILHGGVAATMLDSIGGLQGMLELFQRGHGSFEERRKKVGRLATVDMRVDYLSPGKGTHFTATAEVLRLGRKGCTSRMQLVNDDNKLIAIGTASYAY